MAAAGMLDALEAYLESTQAPLGCIRISELDGFLTALAIGPERVPADEWTAVIWNEQEPVFADPAQRSAVLGGITGRYNEILATIEDGSYTPILLEDHDGSVIPFDWADGFMVGIGLREKAWRPALKSESLGPALFPILALADDDVLDDMTREDADALIATSVETIPAGVIAVASFWRDGPPQPIRRSEPKQGRNDPCACGSGRKFKKCCGAAA